MIGLERPDLTERTSWRVSEGDDCLDRTGLPPLPVMAQNGHARRSREGPLSTVKRTRSERAIPWASTSPVSSAMRQPLRDPRRPTPVCQPGPGRAHHQPEAVVLDFVNPEFFAAFFFGLADSENC